MEAIDGMTLIEKMRKLQDECAAIGYALVPTPLASAMRTSEVSGWENVLGRELAAKVRVQSTEVDGEGFLTLFLSTIYRTSTMKMVNAVPTPFAHEVFAADLAPVIRQINERFVILGSLAAPSSVDLAMMDLTVPRAVFCFLTIKKYDGVLDDIKALGLERLLHEGPVDTITGTKTFWNDL